MARIETFEMERYQSLHWYRVDHDLSESGVSPMTIRDLLGPAADAEAFLHHALGYPLSEGSEEGRAAIAAWYPGADAGNVTMTNGGSEANFLTLWTLLRPKDRLAFMVPNYVQGRGLGAAFGDRADTFGLVRRDARWALDLEALERAVTKRTRAVMVCNPNNPTGAVFTEAEMDAVVEVASRVGAWVVADEIYRGAEVDTDVTSPTFWGRYDKVIVTSGLSKAFAMPGLRVGWVVAPPKQIGRIWRRHDYTTLTPGLLSDALTAVAMQPAVRENILARTRAIIRANLPHLETWIAAHPYLSYVRPVAGAIAFTHVDLPITTADLVERIREERSVLLVPGEMFGVPNGDPVRVRLRHRAHDQGPAAGGRDARRDRRRVSDRVRCAWAPATDEAYLAYHDEEWAVPAHDDRHLFEILVLEGAQAGLSWSTILHKREGYRRAFDGFDPARVARFTPARVERLLQDPGIVRNRLKIESAIDSARATLDVQSEVGSLDVYLWSFVGGAPIANRWRRPADVPAETDVSGAMSKDLKRRGFRFVGPTVCYAFMQATGMVNDHVTACFRWRELDGGSDPPPPAPQPRR